MADLHAKETGALADRDPAEANRPTDADGSNALEPESCARKVASRAR
jgi:hypothetical protein